ncbi:Putative fatty acyl-CoA reductase CG5065 [Gryllus bimaculatus]|nr:Putative fatty acyl-CoA reductase CG5065 [Gryllus bimaculatus]
MRKLLGKHPNCYTFSKRLAETLVDEEKERMPVVIVRPSIVSPSFKEPLPGWVDSLNGPIGLTVGAGKGVIRSMLCGTDYFAEVIPVDIVTNFMIVAAWDRAVNKKHVKETPVFNVSNGDVVKVTWGEVVERGRQLSYQYPFDYVHGTFTEEN